MSSGSRALPATPTSAVENWRFLRLFLFSPSFLDSAPSWCLRRNISPFLPLTPESECPSSSSFLIGERSGQSNLHPYAFRMKRYNHYETHVHIETQRWKLCLLRRKISRSKIFLLSSFSFIKIKNFSFLLSFSFIKILTTKKNSYKTK